MNAMQSMTFVRRAILLSIIALSSSLSGDDSIVDRKYDCETMPFDVADLGRYARGIIDSVLIERNDLGRPDARVSEYEATS